MYSYKTILSPGQGSYTEKGSKFISYAFPIESEENFKTSLNQIKSENKGARHFCYAYRLLIGMTDRSHDAGEPSGTAGKPILNQLLSEDLLNVAIVVVRYVGGTLLGTSGLIAAYKMAAKDVLNQATIVEKEIQFTEQITLPYSQYNEIMKLVKKYGITVKIIKTKEADLELELSGPVRHEKKWKDEWKNIVHHRE